jgi:hypothetical protein
MQRAQDQHEDGEQQEASATAPGIRKAVSKSSSTPAKGEAGGKPVKRSKHKLDEDLPGGGSAAWDDAAAKLGPTAQCISPISKVTSGLKSSMKQPVSRLGGAIALAKLLPNRHPKRLKSAAAATATATAPPVPANNAAPSDSKAAGGMSSNRSGMGQDQLPEAGGAAQKPNAGGKKAAEGGKKAAEGGKKAVEGGKKAAEGGKKAAEGGKKAAEGGKKAVEGGKKAAEGGMKAAEGGKKAVEGGKKAAESGKKAAERGKKAAEGGKKAVEGASPHARGKKTAHSPAPPAAAAATSSKAAAAAAGGGEAAGWLAAPPAKKQRRHPKPAAVAPADLPPVEPHRDYVRARGEEPWRRVAELLGAPVNDDPVLTPHACRAVLDAKREYYKLFREVRSLGCPAWEHPPLFTFLSPKT